MKNTNKPIKTAFKIIFWQLFLIMGLSLVMFGIKGIQSGWSTLLGGLAYWVPTLVFVWRVFAKPFARAAKMFLLKFVTGEALKLICSGILFIIVINYLPVQTVSVLIGFVGAIVAFWISSLLFLEQGEMQ